MRKIFLLLLSVLLITTVTGCQNNTKSTNNNNQIKIAKHTKTVQIKPVQVTNDHDSGKNKIIKIKFKIKNTSKKKIVVAASDFIIKSGESYYYMGEGINFAKTIKSSESTTGVGYYNIPKDLNKFTLMYHPVDSKDNLKWKIKVKE